LSLDDILLEQTVVNTPSPLHFMSTMLALVLAYNPQLIYSAGFELSVAAVFGILLLGSLAGNIYPLLAYPLNACNGFLVTILIQTAEGASSLPFASVTTPGVSLLLVVLFYAGSVPPIVAGGVLCDEHKSQLGALLLLWSALWLALVAAGRI
jgi:predicted membrane metal-binding protein